MPQAQPTPYVQFKGLLEHWPSGQTQCWAPIQYRVTSCLGHIKPGLGRVSYKMQSGLQIFFLTLFTLVAPQSVKNLAHRGVRQYWVYIEMQDRVRQSYSSLLGQGYSTHLFEVQCNLCNQLSVFLAQYIQLYSPVVFFFSGVLSFFIVYILQSTIQHSSSVLPYN